MYSKDRDALSFFLIGHSRFPLPKAVKDIGHVPPMGDRGN